MAKESRGIDLIDEMLGVSIGTVVSDLHARGGIKEATRQRILQVARQVGYTPNRAASALMRRRLYLVLQLFALYLFIPGVVRAQWNPLNPVISVLREADGVQLTLQSGTLKLQVGSDSILRVRYSPTPTFSPPPDCVARNGRR